MAHTHYMDDEAGAEAGKIKLHCHACGAKYLVRADKVQGRRFRAKCKRCDGIIVARHDGDAGFTVLPGQGAGGSSRREDAVRIQDQDLHQGYDDQGYDGQPGQAHEDDGEWYVVVGGRPQGPFVADEVRQGLGDGRFTPRNYVWRPGQDDWQRLRDHPLFGTLDGGTGAAPHFDDAHGHGHAPAHLERPGLSDSYTAETVAGGPRGLQQGRDERYFAGPSDETREASLSGHEPIGEMESEATRLHPARWDELPGGRGGQQPNLEDEWQRGFDSPQFGRRPGKLDKSVDIFDEANWRKEAGVYAQGPSEAEGWGAPINADHIAHPSQWNSAGAQQRRRAILPSPSRSMRASPAELHAQADHVENYTRPLDDHERQMAAQGGAAGPGVGAPAAHRPPPPPPPPKKKKNHDSLSWIPDPLPGALAGAPPPPLQAAPLLDPEPEPFWTTGKVVAAAAIGGGVTVALTVTLVIVLSRPKVPADAQAAALAAQRAAALAAANMAKANAAAANAAKVNAANASAASATPKLRITVKGPDDKGAASKAAVAKKKTGPAKTAKAPAKGSGSGSGSGSAAPAPAKVADKGTGKGSGKGSGSAAPKAVASTKKKKRDPPRRRVAVRTTRLRRRSSRRRSYRRKRRRRKKDDVDALLDGALASSKKRKRRRKRVDADALLDAGSSRRKRRKKSVDADALLNAGGRSSSKPKSLTRGQVRRVMRRMVSRVRQCFDKYKRPGRLTVRMTVRSSGRASARTIGSFAGTPTGNCVAGGASSLRFPSFSGATMRFNYPFNLR